MQIIDNNIADFDKLVDQFEWQIPTHFNIAEAVCDRHAGSTVSSKKTALITVNDKGLTQQYSFEQLGRLSSQLANLLISLGLARGDRVAIVLPQRVETALGHIAVHKAGAISLPLSGLFGADALLYRLADSGAKFVVTNTEQGRKIMSIREQLPDLEAILICDASGCAQDDDASEGAGDHVGDDVSSAIGDVDLWSAISQHSTSFDTVETLADDPACLLYTSGTTGPPKGALIAHRCLIGNLPGFEMSLNHFPHKEDVFFTPADWAWTGGLFDGLLPTLYYGMPVLGFEYKKFEPSNILQLLQDHKVTCGFFPPTALKMLRTVPDIASRFSLSLRVIMSAGEMVGEELLGWAENELGVQINEMYGQTEQNYVVGNCIAIMPSKPGSMGKPYPGHRVEVIQPDGSLAATGDTGEFVAHKDDAVHFLGYWNKPEATASKYTGPWFHTGDVGYRDEDGYLWFVGRADDVITSAGYRIGPGEIEDCILKHPAVLQVAVVGVPDPQGIRGDIVKAFVVLNAGFNANEELSEQIRVAVRDQLAAYEYPREIEFLGELPMTTTGKVRRIELRQRDIDKRT